MKTIEKIAKLNSVLVELVTLKPRLTEPFAGNINGCANLIKQLIEEEEKILKDEDKKGGSLLTVPELMILKKELGLEIQGKLLRFQELAECRVSKIALTRIPEMVSSESMEVTRPEELIVDINVTFNPRGD